MKHWIQWALILSGLWWSLPLWAEPSLPLERLTLPPGFHIEIFAQVPGARQMAVTPDGRHVFVGTRNADKVYVVNDADLDGVANSVQIFAEGLTQPNGVAMFQNDLYVAEVSRILRYADVEKMLKEKAATPDIKPTAEVVTDTLPKEAHHGWKFIRFSPEGWLYVPVGAPCNVCLSQNPEFATILRMRPNGQDREIYARGVRNTVGFDWDAAGTLWFTDNGRDWLGDDSPPDELNHAPEKGMDFGFPYYYGKSVPDPVYAKQKLDLKFTPPALELPAHVAPLGMSFYTGTLFPVEYHQQILIPEHGSWNRSQKIGYQVLLVRVKNGSVEEHRPFISGWLHQGEVWGRPVATLVMPDGAVLISDDFAGVIYRVTYQPVDEQKAKEPN